MNTTKTIYSFPNENFRKTFTNEEDALKFVENKLPANGKFFLLHKEIIETSDKVIDAKCKPTYDVNIIKRIIDAFIEKANPENVKFSSGNTPYKLIDTRYAHIRGNQLEIYYLADKLGYPWEKLDALFENKDGILNGKLDGGYCLESDAHKIDYDSFDARIWPTNRLAKLFMLKELHPELNIDDNDINNHFYNDGYTYRYSIKGIKVNGKTEHHIEDPNTFASKYPNAVDILKEWHNIEFNCWRNVNIKMDEAEAIELYKQRIKEYPIDKIRVIYNYGDYKPCHNYKLEFPEKYDPKGANYSDYNLNTFARIPGIMFRDGDICITTDNYIGRHVNYRGSKIPNVDEELYKYCIKNL